MSESRPESRPAPRPLALVTGASSGIGLAVARRLAVDHDLVLVARSADKLAELAAALERDHGAAVRVVGADLGNPDGVARVAAALDAGRPVDVLVNNAGLGVFGEFAATRLDDELAMLALNVVALTALTKLVVPGMVARGRGRILNVASTAAFQPGPFMAVYFATKAYVLSFSEAIGAELEGSGVTVTALCPGPTASGFQAAAQMESSKLVSGKALPTADEVAAAGVAAMQRGRRVAVVGVKNKLLVQSLRFLPRRTITATVKRMQAPHAR
jgi:short-subunit dehydrogenase